MTDGQVLTRSTYERLREELQDLTTRGRAEIARKIEAARELGDLSENGDYHAAKEEQGKMEARIARLTALLRDAKVVDDGRAVETVEPGCVVKLRFDGETSEEEFFYGSVEERTDVEVITPTSPLGEALAGRTPGEVVVYETPTGTSVRVHLVAVRR